MIHTQSTTEDNMHNLNLNFIPVADRKKIIGTSAKGRLSDKLTVTTLKKIFGNPAKDGADEKTTIAWHITFFDGTIATIYDYRGCKWSIGGFSPKAAELVTAVVEKYQKQHTK